MSVTGAAGDWQLSGSPFRRRVHIYRTAVKVAARYLVVNLPLVGTRDPAARAERLGRAHERGARDVRLTGVKLRGGFLKLGQFVSARPDLLPEAWVTELSLLQDRVPPAPFEAIKRVLEVDLGPIEDHFVSFDEKATASASLVQVHRATTLGADPRGSGAHRADRVGLPHQAELEDGRSRRRMPRHSRGVLNSLCEVSPGDDLPEAMS